MSQERIISGIQQVGIGVSNADEAFAWYRKIFGTDIVVFKDAATADLMKPYTGLQAHQRYAILALNMQSGGGFEIWQYTSRTPVASEIPIQVGDLGIYAVKVKCKNVTAAYDQYKSQGVELLSVPSKLPSGREHFFMRDPYNNIFEITEHDYWFTTNLGLTGAVCGVTIGVSSIERSLPFYKNVLGYDLNLYSGEGKFEDLAGLPGGNHHFKRVILGHSRKQEGAFSKLLGPTQIELIQVTDRSPIKIYANRYWGDLGFIHVCFDINGFEAHEAICNANGAPLTIDSSNSFDMGEAAGHFAYNEDPDGTLIEYVETHRVPILKKIGWYLDLRKRDPKKSLPNWMVKSLGFSRVK
ncbi:MAG: VOC family protein [Chitinophagaceae bacterium]|nr:VOC family protein [Chitinophagaceae bacterium]